MPYLLGGLGWWGHRGAGRVGDRLGDVVGGEDSLPSAVLRRARPPAAAGDRLGEDHQILACCATDGRVRNISTAFPGQARTQWDDLLPCVHQADNCRSLVPPIPAHTQTQWSVHAPSSNDRSPSSVASYRWIAVHRAAPAGIGASSLSSTFGAVRVWAGQKR